MAEIPQATCLNCRRALASRECASAEHRAAHGHDTFDPRTAGKRPCHGTSHRGPQMVDAIRFWNPRGRYFHRTCATCRERARLRSHRTARAQRNRALANSTSERFWRQQAGAHP